MNLSNFEKQVESKIIARGFDYYQGGAVSEVEMTDADTYTAIVEGSDDYEVEVELSGDDIISSSCECPYDWGNYCKHEVAVFYHLKDNKSQLTASFDGSPMEKIERDIYKLTKQDLVDFLLNLSKRDKSVRKELSDLF